MGQPNPQTTLVSLSHDRGLCGNGRTDRDAVCGVDCGLMRPKDSWIGWGPRSPTRKRAFSGAYLGMPWLGSRQHTRTANAAGEFLPPVEILGDILNIVNVSRKVAAGYQYQCYAATYYYTLHRSIRQ